MLKEYTVELPDGTIEYVVELTDEPDKTCELYPFLKSLDFVRKIPEFKIIDIHRYLKCGYGTVLKVINALCSLYVIEKVSGPPNTIYKSLLKGE